MDNGLEGREFKKWLRRPSLLVANGLFLLAAAGKFIVPYIAYGIQWLAGLVFKGARGGVDVYFSTTLYELAVLALPAVWYAARHEGVSQSMRLNPPRLSAMLLAALTAVVGVLFVSDLGSLWILLLQSLGATIYDSGVPIPATQRELLLAVLAVGVVPGVCEELLFRGALLGAWERRGTQYALLITTMLFTALHGSIAGLPTQAIVGLAIGYIVVSSGSLYVGMAYHTTHNSMLMLLSYISMQYMQALPEADVAAALEGVSLLSLLPQTVLVGGLYAFLLSRFAGRRRREGRPFEAVSRPDAEKMGWRELLVLLAGLITVGVLYLQDILLMAGVLTTGG